MEACHSKKLKFSIYDYLGRKQAGSATLYMKPPVTLQFLYLFISKTRYPMNIFCTTDKSLKRVDKED